VYRPAADVNITLSLSNMKLFLLLQRNVISFFFFGFCFHLLHRPSLSFDRQWIISQRTGLRVRKLFLVRVNDCVPFSDKVMASRPDTTCHIKLATPSRVILEPNSCLRCEYWVNGWASGVLCKLRIDEKWLEQQSIHYNCFVPPALTHIKTRKPVFMKFGISVGKNYWTASVFI
jgi:hypothetical protein